MGTLYPTHNPANWVPGTTDNTVRHPGYDYGPEGWQKLHHWKNETRASGGNPWVLVLPGGAWGSKSALSYVETPSYGRIICAMILDPFYGLQSTSLDVFGADYGKFSYGAQAANASMAEYEDTIEDTQPGTGPVTFGGHCRTWINDVQRAVQFIKSNADEFGVDPDRGVILGESAGFTNGAAAYLSLSRSYRSDGRSLGVWDALHPSSVRGCMGVLCAASTHPITGVSVLYTGAAYGLVQNNQASVQAEMNRLLLYPNADGSYTSGSRPRPILTSTSPIEILKAAKAWNRGKHLATWFESGDLGVGPPYQNPHDKRMFQETADACAIAGVTHAGAIMDAASIPDQQTRLETYVPAMKSWIDSRVA